MDDLSNHSNMMCLSSAADSGWVARNVQGDNLSVGCMLKIIQEVEGSAKEEADTNHQKPAQLIALVQGINQKHRLLAARCDLLIEVLLGNVTATSQMRNPGQESPLFSPNEKHGMGKIEGQTVTFDSPPTSGSSSSSSSSSSSEVFSKMNCGFLSSLSSDSDNESSNLSAEKYANSKLDNSGEMLIAEVLKIETELFGNQQKPCVSKDKHANGISKVKEDAEISYLVSKIVECEEEISSLNSRLKNNALMAMDNGTKSMQNDDIEAEGRIISEVFDSNSGRDVLFKELEITEEKVKASEDEIARLKASILTEICQSTCQLQNQLEHYEKEMGLLKANLASENRWASELQEKDGLNAKLQTLNAKLSSKDNEIRQAECQLMQLELQHAVLNVLSDNVFKEKDELKVKVEELEKELKWQAAMSSDRAEEKREAIRQLCFSLEHYRSGYEELHKAYSGQRRHAVSAP